MIDHAVQDNLRAKYNPEGSELRALQLRLIEMLDFIDDICKKNDIKYWLSSGTCLGAIRHSGFIPWDDDLDIEMMREDYLKFEKIFKETDRYALQTASTDYFYTQPFAKLRDKYSYFLEGENARISNKYKYTGVFVDIFVMENSPYWAAESCHFFHGTLRHLSYHCKNSLPYRILYWPLKICTFGYTSLIIALFTKSDGDILRHTCGTGCHKNIRIKKDIFPLGVAEFEGKRYPAPGNVDAYLRRIYGNYSTLPNQIYRHTSYWELW